MTGKRKADDDAAVHSPKKPSLQSPKKESPTAAGQSPKIASGSPKRKAIYISMSVNAPVEFDRKAEEIAEALMKNARVFVIIRNDEPNPGCFLVRSKNGRIFCHLRDMVDPFQPLVDLNVTDLIAEIIGASSQASPAGGSPKWKAVFISMSRDAPVEFDTKAEEIKEGYLVQSRGRVFVIDSRDEDKPGCFIVGSKYGIFCQLRDMVDLDVDRLVFQIVQADLTGSAAGSGRGIFIDMSSDAPEVFDEKAEKIKEGIMKSTGDRVFVSVGKKAEKPGCFVVRSGNGEIFCQLKDMVDPFQPLKYLDVKDVVNQVVRAITEETI